ncbi:MAG TPA: hypothetical protein DEB73_03715 [Candidatus Magasanikbacteria bacterium]|uniref:Type IV pilus biogenesis protein PilM n=1 Tax=Candidatus Magasanikbacteria bacterium GW2011_GWA2_41_55 TaxID=1619038 RepID=A0A0G0YSK8_9BACT|nr:MAG: Type IV pilus biogenesis protein PilM [Candidatus Magasanikbacteria bacterium GW2011_GWA2_41_55]HBV58337.1 hypothetical protein [Candidatus Magasanikbacteria bacterium]HBX16191.1 hypothetical protein [Candidatus Magasanikbacteria bacterium]
MWPFSKPKNFLAVDIGTHGIKLVELQKRGKRAHLFTYAYTDKELSQDQADGHFLNAEAVIDLLKKMVQKSKAVSRQAVASLPASAVFSSIVNIPLISKKEEKDAFIKREAEKLVTIPLTETVLDWKIVAWNNGKEKNEMALLTAAPKKLIASYSEIFKLAGLNLLSLDTEANALISALIGKDPAPTLLIDMGATQTDFFLVEKGIPLFFHSIQMGGRGFTDIIKNTLGVSSEEAEQIKRDLPNHGLGGKTLSGFPAIFEPVLSSLVETIKYSFEIYSKQKENSTARPEKIILTGGSALIPFLDTRLAELLNLKVYIGDPWARIIYDQSLKPTLDQIGPRFSIPIGLALKKIEE